MLLLNHSCSTFRKQRIDGQGISSSYQGNLENIKCLVMPLDDRAAAQNGYDLGKGFNVFFDAGVDIKTGDKLVTSIGETLYVAGVKDYVGMPPVSHLEAVCQTEKV